MKLCVFSVNTIIVSMNTPILILHGWSNTMTGGQYSELAMYFRKKKYEVFVPDLPGFGKEVLVVDPMTLEMYVEWVVKFLKKEQVKKVIIIGHSFGGRIAALLAYKYPKLVEKLILTGSPLIRQPLSFKKQVVSSGVRLMKGGIEKVPLRLQNMLRKGLYYSIGEWDYYKAGRLKETFKKIVHSDLRDILEKITVPTLILWGSRDFFVPLTVGRQIAAKIPGSELVIVSDATHKLPYESPEIFGEEILKWLS